MDTAMPWQLLQPFDGANPASTPVHLSGPEQRLIVTLDPGVGDEALLPPSQLLIGKDGESRSIRPVHLAGWQALGWLLHTQTPVPAPEPEPEALSQPEQDLSQRRSWWMRLTSNWSNRKRRSPPQHRMRPRPPATRWRSPPMVARPCWPHSQPTSRP